MLSRSSVAFLLPLLLAAVLLTGCGESADRAAVVVGEARSRGLQAVDAAVAVGQKVGETVGEVVDGVSDGVGQIQDGVAQMQSGALAIQKGRDRIVGAVTGTGSARSSQSSKSL